MRFTTALLMLIALPLATPTVKTASAQVAADSVAADGVAADPSPYVLAVLRGCDLEDVNLPSEAYVLDVSGNRLQTPSRPVIEGKPISIYVVLPKPFKSLVKLTQTSDTFDPNTRRFAGVELAIAEDAAASALVGTPIECGVKRFRFDTVAASEAEFDMHFLNDPAKPDGFKVTSIKIPVAARYFGAVSFGPIVSLMPDLEYSKYESDTGETLLGVSGGSAAVHQALTFTYYLGGPYTLDNQVKFGPFLSFPMTSSADNFFAGLTIDIGAGLFLLHGGARVGQVGRLRDGIPSEPGSVIPADLELEEADVIQIHPAFGVSVELQAAARAFGKVITSLGGS